MQRLSAADLTNLAVETAASPMHVGALAILDGRGLCDGAGNIQLAQIRSELDRSLTLLPVLRQIVHRPGAFAGRPFWVDDPSFRIDRHVAHVQLPPPGGEDSLLLLAEDLLAAPLERSHPLWRLWLITGLPDGRIAALIALHHSIADGVAAVELITTLLSGAGLAGSDEPAWRAAPPPRWSEAVRDNLRAASAAVRRWRPPTWQRFAASAWGSANVLARAWHAPRTSLTGPVGPHRRLSVLRIDLDTAKRVAHAHGGKVNDVVLGLLASALRDLLLARGECVDRLSLHAAVAISLRNPGEVSGAGNRSGILVARLPLHEADLDVTLRLIGKETARAKRGQVPTAQQNLLLWLARIGLLRHFIRHQRLTHLVESNVVGPPKQIHLLGAPVLDLMPIGALTGNLAIGFVALSYNGTLVITVRADADRYPDLPGLLATMRRDWQRLATGDPQH
jgi:WS/DGAT/MGAT family acyltransferase